MDKEMLEQLFTKTTLLKEIHKIYGRKISWSNLYNFEKKGWINPSFFIEHGKRSLPLYTLSDLNRFIQTLRSMKEINKTYITI